ncbi:DUF3300 domain-containing protein [Pseudomonas boanensis]|uniref:DUF3300 domain-containing protein n=1 Tax=Metapseudomonas boanensis TaxID=2822138 RepID=UPI0035D46655
MCVIHRYSMILLALLALPAHSEDQAPTNQQAAGVAAVPATAAPAQAVFRAEELDQMLAPLALYPDSLLAQVLMASTYPGNVADAVDWSKAHPNVSGDDAVRQVANQPWDPSVQSLVAFPAVLATMGQDPAWVQRVGDAFLAQPNDVMDSVQRLRRQAQAAGNLESNEQQKVIVQPAAPSSSTTVVQQAAPPQTIIIEPADPQVVYVPSYNPNVVYGSWPSPSYPPAYYPPPPGYYLGSALAAGLAFGAGVAIIDSLWGDCDWGGGDIDIDVNRYNNINSNRKINANQNTWRHNAVNRDGVPYRDNASRQKYGRQLDGAQQRDALRGRDPARTADRERARQSLTQRGFEAPAASNRQARERAQTASRDLRQEQRAQPRAQAGDRDLRKDQQARPRATSNTQARQKARNQHASTQGPRNNAFSGTRSPSQSRAQASRGKTSYSAASRPKASQGRTVQRPSHAPSRGGARRR